MLLTAPAAVAATIEVETDADEFGTGSGVCALREAIEAARTNHAFGGCPAGTGKDTVKLTGDTVLTLHGDTATNADGDLDYRGGGKLKILGDEDADIDYPKITQDFSDRVLEITHQKGVKIVGVEIEGGGNVDAGGGVRVADGASAVVDHANIHDNIAELHGGGIACEDCASLKLKGAFSIDDNLADSPTQADGGGVWSDAPLTLDGVSGGLIAFFNASVTNNHLDPTGSSLGRGAGINALDDLTVTDTTFSGNDADDNGFGGGIFTGGNRVTILDSTLHDNTAAGEGAGLFVDGFRPSLDMRRSAVVDNDSTGSGSTGSSFGAGITLDDAGGRITDSAIDGNTATATAAGDTAAGGGIFQSTEEDQPQTLKLNRTSVTNNAVAVGSRPTSGAAACSSRAAWRLSTPRSPTTMPRPPAPTEAACCSKPRATAIRRPAWTSPP